MRAAFAALVPAGSSFMPPINTSFTLRQLLVVTLKPS
jgi:hypothetical protein